MKLTTRITAGLLAVLMVCAMLCSCGKQVEDEVGQGEFVLGAGSASNYETESGVKLKLRTSSDYYIDGEDIVMTAVVTNETDGYIPMRSPVGSYGREGALAVSATADGYELICRSNEWGETMPVSMSDISAPYYFLLEPGQSVTCNYVYKPAVMAGGSEHPLWNTTVVAVLSVQLADKIEKRQNGLEKLDYTSRTITVEITFDGTADRP